MPKPPRIVPESAMMVRSGSAQLMTADPAEFTARFSAKPSTCVSRVWTAVQLPPAGRLAVLISLAAPSQATIALPDPSMPITGPPNASVLTLTGALHVPPGDRTLAWITVAVAGPPSHAATNRPLAEIATAGFSPLSSVTGVVQVSPLELVLATTDDAPWAPVVQTAACAPSVLSANCPTPTAPDGSATGADQVLAACAGTDTAAMTAVIRNAGSAIAPHRMNRDMARSSLVSLIRWTRSRQRNCSAPTSRVQWRRYRSWRPVTY